MTAGEARVNFSAKPPEKEEGEAKVELVIRNVDETERRLGGEYSQRLINSGDGVPNYTLTRHTIEPGMVVKEHTHEWEHVNFILEGHAILKVDGEERPVRPGDAIFVPPNVPHQFINNGPGDLVRLTINPLEAAIRRGGGR